MSIGVYALGYLLVIVGVAYIAHLLHIPQTWIGAIVVVLLGIGLLSGAQTLRAK
jgi:cell shape-determining protein MreD